MNINQLTAARIKELRSKNGLTAEAVAQGLNITRGAYSQLENGHVEITLTRIELLAQIFNVPFAELIPVSVTNHQTFTDNKGGNYGNVGNNNSNTHTVNNFFANNEESLESVMEAIKSVLQGTKTVS